MPCHTSCPFRTVNAPLLWNDLAFADMHKHIDIRLHGTTREATSSKCEVLDHAASSLAQAGSLS